MIIGHGIDLVEIDRVSNIYAKYKENFISKYFINDQLEKIDTNLLANNFAIKEAFSKSIGLGFRSPCYPNNIAVSRDSLGKPVISLKNKLENEKAVIEILEDINRDLNNYDLEYRIQELESKFSKDLSEATFNELKELKKKQNIN